MKKKSLCSVLIIVSLLLLLTSCDIIMGTDGRDGKAYLAVTIDPTAHAWYGYVEGFPEGWLLNTPYVLEEGYHDMEYALCRYVESYSYFDYYINSYSLTNYWAYSDSYVTPLSVLVTYLNSGGDVFIDFFSITVNSGTSGSLLKDGTNGQDKDYLLYLDWDHYNSFISSYGIALEKTISTGEDGATIIEFRDEYRTFTLTIPKNNVSAYSGKNPVVKSVR